MKSATTSYSRCTLNSLLSVMSTNLPFHLVQLTYRASTSHVNHQTDTVVEQVTGAVTQLVTAANNCNIQLLYVIPRYTYSITKKEYNQFTTTLQSHLTSSNINSISIGTVMSEISQNMNITEFDQILDNCTSDGVHLTFETGQHVLTAITSHFDLPHILPVTTISNQYFAVQQYWTDDY